MSNVYCFKKILYCHKNLLGNYIILYYLKILIDKNNFDKVYFGVIV